MMENYERALAVAFQQAQHAPMETIDAALRLMGEAPEDPRSVFLMGEIMLRAQNPQLSYQLYRRCVEMAPQSESAWNNLGKAAQELNRPDEAKGYFQKAIDLVPDFDAALQNMATVAMNEGRPEDALAICEKLTTGRFGQQAMDVLGMCQLALGQWDRGWANFEHSLGNKYRKVKTYGENAERWNGPDIRIPETVVDEYGYKDTEIFALEPSWSRDLIVYGEQGIGDEIFFGSIIPDLENCGQHVILDVDERLAGLFHRSFPWAEVHGTRRDEIPDWYDPGKEYDWCAIGSLGAHYRRSEASFPGTPYLKPDPLRTFQWQATFKGVVKRSPVIGIAWTGGRIQTGHYDKSLKLEQLLPLFKAFPDAQFVSLEYQARSGDVKRFANEHKVNLVHFRHATETDDHDNTAALVAACDVVVSVMTSVAHLAAAMGKQTYMMMPTRVQPMWRYHNRPTSIPWYKSLRLCRQKNAGEWGPVIDEVIGLVRDGNNSV